METKWPCYSSLSLSHYHGYHLTIFHRPVTSTMGQKNWACLIILFRHSCLKTDLISSVNHKKLNNKMSKLVNSVWLYLVRGMAICFPSSILSSSNFQCQFCSLFRCFIWWRLMRKVHQIDKICYRSSYLQYTIYRT